MNQSEFEEITWSGQIRAFKSRLVLVLLLVGWKSGVISANQSHSEVKRNKTQGQLFSTINWKPLHKTIKLLPFRHLGPVKPFGQVQLNFPNPRFTHVPLFLQGFSSQGSGPMKELKALVQKVAILRVCPLTECSVRFLMSRLYLVSNQEKFCKGYGNQTIQCTVMQDRALFSGTVNVLLLKQRLMHETHDKRVQRATCPSPNRCLEFL